MEVGGAEGVAQVAVLSIRHKPRTVLADEGAVVGVLLNLVVLLVVDLMQVGYLSVVDPFIINLHQRVQILLQVSIVLAALGILQLRQRLEVGILRVEGKDADAGVGIGVGPGVSRSGVVDRQHLQHALACLCNEVDHLAEVAEVTHAEAVLRAQREDRDEGAGELAVPEFEEGLVEFVDDAVACHHLGYVHLTVQARLPHWRDILFAVERDELEFDVRGQVVGVEVERPEVMVDVHHLQGLQRFPVAQPRAADECEALTTAELRRADDEADGLGIACCLSLGKALLVEAVGVGRAVEVGVLGHGVETVVARVG